MKTYEQRGRDFHEQLFALMPQAEHEEDPDHHRAVGEALHIALEDGDPERAEKNYNEWALAHSYEPVKFMRREDGAFVADIVEAVIRINMDGTVSLVETRI